jgi:hypothetical protein
VAGAELFGLYVSVDAEWSADPGRNQSDDHHHFNSGVYTVIVSNGPGCTAESDPIDISIALTPDLCHKCRVDIREFRFRCIGTDPLTGQPLYTNSG